MFKVEFLSLLKEIKQSSGQQREQLLFSLSKLLQEHIQEYHELEQEGLITSEIESIVSEAQNLNDENQEKSNESSDLEKIKYAFSKWLEEYNVSGQTTQTMASIVDELVLFYAPQRFDVLKQILEIKDTPEFETFKLHIKNRLRAYYAQKIQEYMSSDSYYSLSFFKKLRKNKELRKLLKNINSYNFDPERVYGVIQ